MARRSDGGANALLTGKVLTAVATVTVLLELVNTHLMWLRQDRSTGVDLYVLVVSVLVLCTIWCGITLVRSLSLRWPMRVLVGSALLVAVISPWIASPDDAQGQPWQMHIWLLGSFCSVLALPLPVGLATSVAIMAGYAAQVAPQRGLLQAGLGAVLLWVMTQLGGWLVLLSRRGAVALGQALVAERRALAVESRTRAHDAASEWWVGSVRDGVLTALDLGAEMTDATLSRARNAARASLTESGPRAPGPASDLVASLTRRAAGLGLALDVEVDARGIPPEQFAEAIEGALGEALANVALHADTRRATLSGVMSASSATLTVSDAGVGFDPERSLRGHWGIRRGIHERMARIGGDSDIRSGPRAGTSVTVSWAAPKVDPEVWFPRQPFAWLLGPGLLSIGAHALLGHDVARTSPGSVPSLVLLWLTAGALVISMLSAAASGRWTPLAWASTAALPVLVALGLSNTEPVPHTDYRTWMTGAAVPTAVALAIVGHRWFAAVASGATFATVLVQGTLMGYDVASLTAVSVQILILPLWAIGVFHQLDRQATRRTAAASTALAANARSLEHEERAQHWTAGAGLVRELADPALTELSSARRVDEALRARCAAAAVAVRAEIDRLDPAHARARTETGDDDAAGRVGEAEVGQEAGSPVSWDTDQ